MKKIMLTLSDGRSVAVHTEGESSANAVLFHHGTPGCAQTWDDWLPEVARLGGYAISYSRPGYGNSSRHSGRTVLDNAQDIAEILEQLNVQKIISIGWSGGGPHALADSTLKASVAVISLAGVGEYGATDLDFLAGMGEENHVEFGAAIEGPAAIQAWMEANSGGTAKVTGSELIEELGGLIGDADKASLTPEVAETIAGEFRAALEHSYLGWMDDDLAFVEPWGFDITKITQPVSIWQGDQDFMVPHSHGYWLQNHIPNAKLNFVPGEGHISLGINKRAEIIASALDYLSD